jgi:hypothetical protein
MYSDCRLGDSREIHTNSKLQFSESLSQWLVHCTAMCCAGHSAFTFCILTVDVLGTVKISCVSIRINYTRQFAVRNIGCLMLKSNTVHVITERFYPNNTDVCVCARAYVCVCVGGGGLYCRQLSVPIHMCVAHDLFDV